MATSLFLPLHAMSRPLQASEARSGIATTNTELPLFPWILQRVEVGAQLGIAVIRSIGWTVLLLSKGPSSVASLHWVLLGKPPLNGVTKAANIVIECHKLSVAAAVP